MKKDIRKLFNQRLGVLQGRDYTLQTVYEIMFSDDSRILAEENDGFCIKKHTFGDVRKRIEKASAELNRRIGGDGQYVGIAMENSVSWIVAFWAVLRSGNQPFLINMRHPATLTEEFLKILSIRTVIAAEEGGLPVQYLTVAQLESGQNEGDFAGAFADGFALSTSATGLKPVVCYYTGRKIVEQLLNSGDIVKRCPQIADTYRGELKQLAFLPFYHVFGLFAVYFWFVFFGCTLVFLQNYAPETITKTCRRHQVTHIFAVPLFWHSVEDSITEEISKLEQKEQDKFRKGARLCEKLQNFHFGLGQFAARKLLSRVQDSVFGPSICFCISGGSYIRSSTLQLLNSIGYSLHNGYGMSEVGITSVELRVKPKYTNSNCIGQPFGSVEYDISEKGTLLIRGRSICQGIYRDGNYADVEGWYDSGDLVEMVNGDYYIKGRMSDVIIGENGENVNPDLLEKEFSFLPSGSFSILGMEVNGKETVTMVVKVGAGISQEALEQMIQQIYQVNSSLPATTAVQAFFITQDDLMSKNAVKLSRSYIAREVKNGSIRLTPFAQAKEVEAAAHDNQALEAEIKAVVAKILKRPADAIANDANFIFDLGASSLEYLSLMLEIENHFSVTNILDGKNCYTVNDLYEYIERHK